MKLRSQLKMSSLLPLIVFSLVLVLGIGASALAKQIAVVTPYYANATTREVIDLFTKFSRERGWNATTTDTASDFNKLVSAIEDAVILKVDAIVLGMGDPAQMTKGLEAAQAAGIPIIGIDAGISPYLITNVTSDNTALGQASAESLVEFIGYEGNVVMFTHDPHPGVRARAEGAAAVFAKYPGIKVIDKIHINVPGPVDNARKVMQDLLTANPQRGSIAGVWAGWDEPALGALQAAEASRRDGELAIVGVDGTDFAVAEINAGGAFKSTIAQDWEAIARKTIEVLEQTFAGNPPNEEQITLPGRLITAGN